MADRIGRPPHHRKGQRIADDRTEKGGEDVAADEEGDGHRHQEVKAEQRCPRHQHAAGEAGRDRVRRGAEPKHALAEILERTLPALARPDGYAQFFGSGRWRATTKQHAFKQPIRGFPA